MDINDFCYMRKGKQIAPLTPEDCELLKAIEQKGSGSQKALLLLHGFSSSPAVFRKLIPEIKGYDAIVCPVLPGHAQNMDQFSKSKAQDWISKAHITCQSLVDEYEEVHVLGFSLGGLLACELSQQIPIQRLYLLAPALYLGTYSPLMLKVAQMLKALGCKQIKNLGGDLLSNEAEITYKFLPLNPIIEVMSLILNYDWITPACPMDIFLGTYDKVISSAKVNKLFAPLQGAQVHWLKKSAHILPLDNDYEEIIRCINAELT